MQIVRDDIPVADKEPYVLEDFSGGMRRDTEPFRLANNEYTIMSNGRARNGSIIPIRYPFDMSNQMPFGLYQGIFGYDSVLIVSIDGKIYGRDFAQTNSFFQQIPGVTLDSFVDTVFGELVPASWQNLQRKLVDGTDISQGVKLFSSIFGTPACLILQDGSTQPWLIFSTGSARQAQTFSQWQNTTDTMEEDTREYVPIGKQMMWSPDGRLYIISSDGKKIYRSVTGRPLDFVIAIDQNGDKLMSLTSGEEEASRLSYAVSFEPITCIEQIPSVPRVQNEEAGFYVGSRKRSWIVYPTYNNSLFGEPVFTNQLLFSTGPINQMSLTDLLGDMGVITESGITSFDSILYAANEGKNAPFHKQVHRLFVRPDGTEIVQTVTAAITSNDYGMFAMESIYGNGILIYDALLEKFISFDIYPAIIGKIKQFAEIKVNGQRRLFFITTGNQIFEFDAGETAEVTLYTKEFQSQKVECELIPRRIRLIFGDIQESGIVKVSGVVNNVVGEERVTKVVVTGVSQTTPLQIPFGGIKNENVKNKTINIEKPIKGQQVGVLVKYNFKASLQKIELITEDEIKANTGDEQGEIFDAVKTL